MDEKIIIQKNEKHNGLEIKFPSKPPEDVRSFLKEKGFRWNRVAAVWYTKWDDNLAQEMKDRFVE